MTKQTRKRLFSAGFFFVVLALTFWFVFRDENLSKVARYLKDADVRFVLPAVGAVVAEVVVVVQDLLAIK